MGRQNTNIRWGIKPRPQNRATIRWWNKRGIKMEMKVVGRIPRRFGDGGSSS